MSDWSSLITDSTKEVSDIDFNTNGILTAFYKENDHYNDGGNSNTKVNVVLAYHAHLKLLPEMQKLADHVFYHDTDSIIFLTTNVQLKAFH